MSLAASSLCALFRSPINEDSFRGGLLLGEYLIRTGIERDKAESKAAQAQKGKRGRGR